MGDPKVRATVWEKYVKCSKSTRKEVKVQPEVAKKLLNLEILAKYT
jgi:hypothetical protein